MRQRLHRVGGRLAVPEVSRLSLLRVHADVSNNPLRRRNLQQLTTKIRRALVRKLRLQGVHGSDDRCALGKMRRQSSEFGVARLSERLSHGQETAAVVAVRTLGYQRCFAYTLFDQPGNAARVEYHGLGVQLRGRGTRTQLRRLLDLVLQSSEIRESTTRMQRRFQAADSNPPAVDIIEDYLEKRLSMNTNATRNSGQLSIVHT